MTLTELKTVQNEITQIQQRNKKVELDKAWETSITRKIIILILTYLVIVVFFYIAKLPYPFYNALVPTIAFILSTSSIPVFKKIWIKYIHKK